MEHDYFQDDDPRVWDEPGTYADFDAETVHNLTYEWNHTLGKVITAVSNVGLRVELLHEFDYTKFARWPLLEKSGFDTYRLPEGTPRLPLMYSLRARKACVGAVGASRSALPDARAYDGLRCTAADLARS